MDLSLRLSGALALWFSVTGCGWNDLAHIAGGYNCTKRDVGFIDPESGIPDPCHERTPWPEPVDPNACKGECVPIPPRGMGHWDPNPLLFWIAPIGQAPQCPDSAPRPWFQGYTDIEEPPLECDVCTCEASTGSCGLPTDMEIKAHAATCQNLNQSTPETSFDPPQGWSGSCTSTTQIPAGMPCPGGVDCAQSLTIDPLVIVQEQCAPAVVPVPHKRTPAHFLKEAWTCDGVEEDGGCPHRDEYCAPKPPPGFRACLYWEHEIVECPEDLGYTDQYILHQDVKDHRTCTPCTCGTPAGSLCTGCIGTYVDDTCTTMRSCYDITSAGPDCKNVMPPGAALLSKQLVNPTYHPGTCEPSGGEPTGNVELIEPATVCCRPAVP